MCQARSQGGIRCTAHAVKALSKAQEAIEANTDPSKFPDLQLALDKARFDYNLTKEGIALLKEAGKHQEAQDFEDARTRILAASKAKREKLRAREDARLRGKLKGLFTADGVEELRIHGNDKLADKVQVHIERKMHEEAVAKQEHSGSETDDANDGRAAKPVAPTRPPSIAKAVALGAMHGAIQGAKTGHGFRAGIAAGTAQSKSAMAKREAFVRDGERAKQAEEREQQQAEASEAKARLVQEREDARLEAECMKWLRQQEREEAKIRQETRTKRTTSKPSRSKQSVLV